jgi:hypothetical protein
MPPRTHSGWTTARPTTQARRPGRPRRPGLSPPGRGRPEQHRHGPSRPARTSRHDLQRPRRAALPLLVTAPAESPALLPVRPQPRPPPRARVAGGCRSPETRPRAGRSRWNPGHSRCSSALRPRRVARRRGRRRAG